MNSEQDTDPRRKGESEEAGGDNFKATGSKDPHCIYFYYLKPVHSTHSEVRVYFEDKKRPIGADELDWIVKDYVGKVRNNNWTPIGWAFEDVRWRRKSYLIIVVDDEDFVFSDIEMSLRPRKEKINHTISHKKEIGPFGNVSGVRFLNEIEHRSGKWDQEPEVFSIKITSKDERLVKSNRTHEESGTNMGPPIQP